MAQQVCSLGLATVVDSGLRIEGKSCKTTCSRCNSFPSHLPNKKTGTPHQQGCRRPVWAQALFARIA